MTSLATANKSKPFIPLAGLRNDGRSTADEATATCFCGAVQISVPTKAPGLVNVFVCNCYDCHKITASMFATNFTVADENITWIRGRKNLKTFAQADSIASGKTMTNYFCSTCGTLMNRVGAAFPGLNFLRVGTVDDFNLHETLMKPQIEQFVKDLVNWLPGLGHVEGIKTFDAMFH